MYIVYRPRVYMPTKITFKENVYTLFKKGYKPAEIVREYDVKNRSQADRGIPTRAMLYRWFDSYKNKGKKVDKKTSLHLLITQKSTQKQVKSDFNTPDPLKETTDYDTPSTHGSPTLSIETGQEPVIPESTKPVGSTEDFKQTEQQQQLASPYGPDLKFIKLLASVPSEGASTAFEEAFHTRGVDLNQVPFIKWSEWKTLQTESANGVISMATGGLVKPEWLKKLMPWYPVIDLVASYAVPTTAAILWTASQQNKKAPAQQDRRDIQVPEGINVTYGGTETK